MIETLLLLALPASGKSEVRRYLDHLEPDVLRDEMHLGQTTQLDDYPYVHLMRRISQEMAAAGATPAFFASDDSPWSEQRDWITLINLLNDDYSAVRSGGRSGESVKQFLDRLAQARMTAGAPDPLAGVGPDVRDAVERGIAPDVADLAPLETIGESTTVVIEFARGGPNGADLPLSGPLGYAASLAALDDAILERASVLYVWVEPEESRRRNRERAKPGPDGDASILHHGVPEPVMFGDYGLDDIGWLEQEARAPGTIPVGEHDLPFARFDNRVDRTSFLRADASEWPAAAVETLHADLAAALRGLAQH